MLRSGFILLLKGFAALPTPIFLGLLQCKKRKKALRAPRPSQVRCSTPHANIKTWKNNQWEIICISVRELGHPQGRGIIYHCTIEAMYTVIPHEIYKVRNSSWGENLRTNKNVPHRMIIYQSQLEFYIIKYCLIFDNWFGHHPLLAINKKSTVRTKRNNERALTEKKLSSSKVWSPRYLKNNHLTLCSKKIFCAPKTHLRISSCILKIS